MNYINSKTSSQFDTIKVIELEKNEITIENAHDVIANLSSKYSKVYEKYSTPLYSIYRSIEDEYLADQIYAIFFQFIVNLSLLKIDDRAILGSFLEMDDDFLWPNQEQFLGKPEGIPLLNSILKYSLYQFVQNDYYDLPDIYTKLNHEIKKYLENNKTLPKDIETLLPIENNRDLN